MRMLEQPQKLLVQNALALGVALAELAETVCIVGVKADKVRLNLALKVDDSIPTCFLHGTGIEYSGSGVCSLFMAGVIDASMNLRFCNNYSSKLIKIYKDGDFISWNSLVNHLWQVYYGLRLTALEKICMDCKGFNITCNGDCWIPKEVITKQTIAVNSSISFK